MNLSERDTVRTAHTNEEPIHETGTVQPTAKGAKAVTFSVADHTEIDRGTNVAKLADLKVGDRVLVEIPKGKTEAESIKIGVAAAAKPSAKSANQKPQN
jgi:hypothetical protein